MQLEDRLAAEGERADTARERAEQLIRLNAALDRDLKLGETEANLNGLLRIHDQLKVSSDSVADAVQTLELFGEFQNEFSSQMQVLGDMRRSLVEISLMETTFGKVVRMLEPLADLGNLRRLSDDDMRQAVRSILDARQTVRVSRNSNETRTSTEVAPTPAEAPAAE